MMIYEYRASELRICVMAVRGDYSNLLSKQDISSLVIMNNL
jgi:hypothetical protein